MNNIQPPGDPLSKDQSKFRQFVEEHKAGRRGFRWVIWALLGPGLLALVGDNDAGGIISYAVTGAQFGIGLFIPLILCLAPLTYTVQEMATRVGAVTQTGYIKLIFSHYGRFWGYYQLSTLMIQNLLTLMTEFIGMTAGLVILGVPMWLSDSISLLLVLSLAIFTGYWTKERFAIFVGALNVVFVVVAFMTHPSARAIGQAFLSWGVPHHNDVIWYIIATIGNAVAPWMIFFQGSAVIDKGITAETLYLERIDTAIGSVVQVLIAACIILCGAALYGKVYNIDSTDPATMLNGLDTVVGRWPSILFGFGLFNAGLLAAITVSLSSSWCLAEAFGWSRSLNDRVSTARNFYAVYIGSLVLAALVILIPNLPFNFISVFTQAIGGFLMAPILIFLLLFTSNEQLMGKYKSSIFGRVCGWTIVSVLIGLAALLVWNTLAG